MPRLNRLHQNRVTHPTAIESAHVEAYVEQLQKSPASAKGARHGVVPKSTRVDRQLAGAGDGQRADALPPRSIQRRYASPGNPFIPTGHGPRIARGMVMRCARQMLYDAL